MPRRCEKADNPRIGKLGRARRFALVMLGCCAAVAPSLATALSRVEACGTITGNVVWTADNLYVLNGCAVTVAAGGSLTIQAGTIVKLSGSHDKIIVNGALVVDGTEGAPVVLTSLRDDRYGGDTNGDSDATSPQPGDWGWLVFQPGSSGTLRHAYVAYGGVGDHGYTEWAMVKAYDAELTLDHVTIEQAWSEGVFVQRGHAIITNSVFSGSGRGSYQLHVDGMTPGAPVVISGNQFVAAASNQWAAHLAIAGHPDQIVLHDNHATGSALNGFVLDGSVAGGLLLDVVDNAPLIVNAWLSIPSGATLTLTPGTVFKPVGCGGKLIIDGTLVARGTADSPIAFTSLQDDARGGDTNGDAAASTPQPTDWGYIRFTAGSSGTLDHVFVGFGGVACSGYDNYSMLQAYNAEVTLGHATLQDSYGNGLYAAGASVSVADSRIVGNGRYFGSYGLHYDALDPDVPLAITDTAFETGSSIQRAARINLGNPSAGHPPSHPATIRMQRNTASGTGWNGAVVAGDVQRDLLLDVDDSIPLIVEGAVHVMTDTTLTLSPSTVFKPTGCGGKLAVDGTLVARGTAEKPIVFTSLQDDSRGGDTNGDGAASSAQRADWGYIRFNTDATGVLDHLFIGYGAAGCSGYDTYAMFQTYGATVGVEHTTFDAYRWNGVYSSEARLTIHHSNFPKGLPENPMAVNNAGSRLWVDARHNWWGDASGPYHPALNATASGAPVSDRVRFLPWAIDESGTEVTQVLVSGPPTVSPGQTVDYAVWYYTGQDIADAVLKLTLPAGGEYVDSGQGGVHWFDNREVFWRLNLLPAGSEGTVSVRVRFPWGLPSGLRGGASAVLDGSNIDAGTFDFDTGPYYAYQPPAQVEPARLSPAAVEALITARPDASGIYTAALAAGFTLIGGAHLRVDAAGEVTEALLIKGSAVQHLYWRNQEFLSVRLHPGGAVFEDAGGSMSIDSNTGTVSYAGSWAGGGSAAALPEDQSIGKGACMNNCIMQRGLDLIKTGELAREAVSPSGATQRILGHRLWPALNSRACQFACVKLNECSQCLLDLTDAEKGLPEIEQLIVNCNSSCENTKERPKSSCTYGQLSSDPPPPPIFVCGSDAEASVIYLSVFRCDKQTGAWRQETGDKWDCSCSRFSQGQGTVGVRCEQQGTNARCLGNTSEFPGGRPCGDPKQPQNTTAQYHRPCNAQSFAGYWGEGAGGAQRRATTLPVSAGSRPCAEMRTMVRVARDPNAKLGVRGDLIPGQALTYTITYENEGAGRAYGVYITDELAKEFDESTLTMPGGSAQYIASARIVLWDIGELAPKGEAGSKGEVTFSVKLKTGLPSGTVIANQATVYFPSVPEETPTNTVVNTVQPLAAAPQSLETTYGQPVGITLSGSDVSGTPLTYAIGESPLSGDLTGTPPALTYAPGVNFTGMDRLTFTVNNGTSESRPADVTILVNPSPADTTSPEVAWTYPEDSASLEEVSVQPISTDDVGPAYAPSLLTGFSEALDPATVTDQTITLADATARPVAVSVVWDGTTNQAVIVPREPWRRTSYTLTVTTGVTDASGNPLAADYAWTFRITSLVDGTCVGDCDTSEAVTVDELVKGVNIALGTAALSTCSILDANNDGTVTVEELVQAVDAALNGCPPAALSTRPIP